MKEEVKQVLADIRCGFHQKGTLQSDEDILLIENGYALLEQVKEKSCCYRAVDLCSGEIHLIRRTHNPVSESHPEYIEQMKCSLRLLPSVRCPYLELPLRERAALFLHRIFTEIYPSHGMALREGQLALALDMLSILQGSKIGLCEAEIGIGKTHAYLTAAVVYRLFSEESKPVLLSTSTLALQDAVVKEFIPKISEILFAHRILNHPLKAAVRKGRGNYLCEHRLNDLMRDKANSRHISKSDTKIINLLSNQKEVSFRSIDLTNYSLSAFTRRHIALDGPCVEKCPRRSSCRFLQFAEACMHDHCDLVVTNHNLLLADTARRQNGSCLLPECGAVIIDEAHKLPAISQDMYTVECSENALDALLVKLKPIRIESKAKQKKLAEHLQSLQRIWSVLFKRLCRRIKSNGEETRFALHLDAIEVSLVKTAAESLRRFPDYCLSLDVDALTKRISSIRQTCLDIEEKLIETLHSERICWIENKNPVNVVICSLSPHLSLQLYQGLWSKNIPYILTSGTLSAGGDFSVIRSSLGISYAAASRVRETYQKSPYNYKDCTMLYLPRNIFRADFFP